jgi:hypothetical protein
METWLMKKFLLMTFIFVSNFAFASDYYSPNRYKCVFGDQTVIYSTTSKSGRPSFFLDFGNESKPFQAYGASITVQNTAIGTLVNARIRVIPDGDSWAYSVIVPQINLSKANPVAEFDTQLVYTQTKGSIAGPEGVEGVIENNRFAAGKCQATSVQF